MSAGRNQIQRVLLTPTTDTTYTLTTFTSSTITARDYRVIVETLYDAAVPRVVLSAKTDTTFTIDVIAQASPPTIVDAWVWLEFLVPVEAPE